MLENNSDLGSKIKYIKDEKRKPKNRLTPPRDGLEVLLHRTDTSFLFLIPRFCENFRSSKLTTNDIIREPVKKMK